MTIVKRFSDSLKNLTLELKSLNIQVIALNGSKPKYIPYNYSSDSSYTKGVDSDHIKIFQISKTQSFAFAFNFTKSEVPFIMVTTKYDKKNNEVFHGSKLNEETFKTCLKSFIKKIKDWNSTNSLTPDLLISLVHSEFISGREYDSSAEVLEAVSKSEKEVLLLETKRKSNLVRKKELETSLLSNKKVLEAKVNEAKVLHKVSELEKQLKAAQKEVQKVKDKYSKSLKITDEENLLSQVNKELNAHQSEVDKIVYEKTKHLPRVGVEKVKKAVMK